MRPELLTRRSGTETDYPPLLFVHGAFAGAWCWELNFLPFFQSHGFDCFALSFRGHGGSPGYARLWMFGIDEYVRDLAYALQQMPSRPVVIAHSLGTFVVQRLLDRELLDLAGVVLLSPTSPAVHFGVALRMMLDHPWLCWKMSLMNSLPKLVWRFAVSPGEMRRLMLSDASSLETVERIFPRLQHESFRAMSEMVWRFRPFRIPSDLPFLVMGGGQDVIVPPAFVRRVAAEIERPAVILPDLGHSLMLEDDWRDPADRILAWLQQFRRERSPAEVT